MKTLDECKDQVARANGKESWLMWGYECSEPYGHSIPEKRLNYTLSISRMRLND